MRHALRCAIYTRKSTDDGLEQEFNSLDAQRDACEAYIRSQTGEGWRLVSTRYDDGGFSGGSMDRPGLRNLLEDIAANRIDVVVVYKVDRLTRSLADFAKIVERFDTAQVSFVSVTQQFNTTTSMGRLTLNMLLSFAQFEREVTAERIRDKIAASKRKGMWMGGPAPLGYDVRDKALIINKREAADVRRIFELYFELGSVRLLQQRLETDCIHTKRRRLKNGQNSGGKIFSRGNLYQLLANPIYAGKIPHKGETFDGRHERIIDPELWHAVQTRLTDNAAPRRRAGNTTSAAPLAGMMFDETGDCLSPTHASKNGRRYRYYASHRLMTGERQRGDGCRLPAPKIEQAILSILRNALSDKAATIDLIGVTDANDIVRATASIDRVLAQPEHDALIALRPVVRRIDVTNSYLRIAIGLAELARLLGASTVSDQQATHQIEAPITLRRRGVETKIILAHADSASVSPDRNLVMLIARARLWFDALASGACGTVREIASVFEVDESDVSRFLPLAFLAPSIVEAIVDGRQPIGLTAERLKRLPKLPLDWHNQRQALGFD